MSLLDVCVLRGILPDFLLDDVRFGDYYDLIDEIGDANTDFFNYFYVKALVLKLCGVSGSSDVLAMFRKAFENLTKDYASNLMKSNKNLDLREFLEHWGHAISGPLIEKEALKRFMFKKDYSDPSYSKTLVDQIHENIVEYATGLFYHAPYAAFCQSSGTGKTKTIISLGEHSILFYICGRAAGGEYIGYPPRSRIFDKIQSFESSADFLVFFYSLLEEFLNLIRDGEMVSAVLREDEGSLLSLNFFRSFSLLLADPDSDLHKRFWTGVENRVNSIKGASPAYLNFLAQASNYATRTSKQREKREPLGTLYVSPLSHWFTAITAQIMALAIQLPGAETFATDPKIPIIIAFDEARNLLGDNYDASLFRYLRHASVALVNNCFILLSDTTSRTSNFAYPLEKERSTRWQVEGGDLFTPFLYLPWSNQVKVKWVNDTVDFQYIHPYNNSSGDTRSSSSQDVPYRWTSLKYDPLECISYSRPMFGVCCNARIGIGFKDRYDSCVTLAIKKLKNPYIDAKSAGDKSLERLYFRAIAAGLVDLSFSEFGINDDLVGSYLAFGVSISEDRSFLHARYLPEAVTGEALCRLYKDNRKTVLRQLSQDVKQCVPLEVDKGLKGERLAALYLVSAKILVDDEAGRTYSTPCTVGEFLAKLVGTALAEKLDRETAYSFMAFNTARICEIDITREVLLDAWRKRVILYCPTGTRSIDLVIPIVKSSFVSSSSAGGLPYVEPTINTISCIAVQVKNMKDKLYFKPPKVASSVQGTPGDMPRSSSPLSVTSTSTLSEGPFRETPSRPSSPSASAPSGLKKLF